MNDDLNVANTLQKINVYITARRVSLNKLDKIPISYEREDRILEIEKSYIRSMTNLIGRLTDEELIYMYSTFILMRKYIKPFLSEEIITAGLIMGD